MSKQPLYERLSRARQTLDWPLSHLIVFVFALPLLLVWLLVGLVSWWVLFLLGWVRAGVTVEILAALIPAFIGFAVQQWSLLVAEEKLREDRRKEAQNEIRRLAGLVNSDPSEGGRRYLEYIQSDDWVWQDPMIQQHLRGVWEIASPQALRHTVALRSALVDDEKWKKAQAEIGTENVHKSLVWAWRMLDEDWQKHIRPMLAGTVEREIESRSWQAILKPWRQVCFWKPNCFHTPPNLAKAIELLELQRNPFSSERAEQDDLLFETWVGLEWSLQTPQPQIIVGKHGAGKTALALYTIRNSIEHKTAFPIYVPDFPNEPTPYAQLDNFARAMARTLLHFLAFYPRSFLEQDIASQSAMTHLLGLYIGTGSNLALQLQKAGLESIAEGKRMFQELERLLSNISLARPPDDELITLLSAARPSGFPCTIILVDLPEVSETTIKTLGDTARALLDLLSAFHGEPIYLKMLLPDALSALAPNNDVIRLVWSEERLRTLLRNRLGILGAKSLNAWCDPEAAQSDPDQSMIQAAQGLPGRLIHLGNELLAQLASHPDYPKITAQDLDKVLGNL